MSGLPCAAIKESIWHSVRTFVSCSYNLFEVWCRVLSSFPSTYSTPAIIRLAGLPAIKIAVSRSTRTWARLGFSVLRFISTNPNHREERCIGNRGSNAQKSGVGFQAGPTTNYKAIVGAL